MPYLNKEVERLAFVDQLLDASTTGILYVFLVLRGRKQVWRKATPR